MACNNCSKSNNEEDLKKLKETSSWLPGLSEFLKGQTQVEAVKFDPEKRVISIATLGRVDEKELEEHLTSTLKSIQQNLVDHSTATTGRIPPAYHISKEGNRTLLQKPSCYTAPHLWVWREMPWPTVIVKEPLMPEWAFLGILSGLCAVFAITGYIIQRYYAPQPTPLASIILYILAIIAGGWDATISVFKRLKKKELDIHALMIAVALGASCIGAWEEAAILLFLFSFAEALEDYTMYRTRRSIDALFKATPKEAVLILPDGSEQKIPVESVVPNQILFVRPGDVFPVDGIILEGETAADESNLTGEAVPVDKKIGSTVFSGTINLWGAVKTSVLKPVNESALQKVINLIQEAQNLKAPSQRFTEKFGTHYTIAIFSITFLMFLFWGFYEHIPLFKNTIEQGYSAFYRSMTLLVVASPCALVISIPSAILAAIAWGAQHGVLFRGGVALEKLCQVNYVALDKTGTLTTGNLKVESIESYPPGKEKLIATWAYSLEKKASHPLARAIVEYGRREKLEEKEVQSFQSLTGLGVQGIIDGELCVLGRRKLLDEGKLKQWIKDLPLPQPQYTEVWVMQKSVIGRILLKDEIRRESKQVLASLKKRGLRTVMLTGDRKQVAEAIGYELGIDEIRAELSPEDKVKIIYEAGQQGAKVAMIGDGVNDAPSLAAAYVSVAMGVRGSDAALEQSEIILMQDKIDNFSAAYDLSTRAKSIIRQNLTISLGVIIIMVLSAVAGIVPLTLGVVAHEGSTLVVCLNSVRLLLSNNKKKHS